VPAIFLYAGLRLFRFQRAVAFSEAFIDVSVTYGRSPPERCLVKYMGTAQAVLEALLRVRTDEGP
jgi:hypothetical protein